MQVSVVMMNRIILSYVIPTVIVNVIATDIHIHTVITTRNVFIDDVHNCFNSSNSILFL